MSISQVNTPMNFFERLKDHKGHLERLVQTRTHLDDHAPPPPSFLAKKLICRGVRMDKKMKIEHENQVIYTRMAEIQSKTSPYSRVFKPSACPAYQLITYHRLKKQNQIYNENNYLHRKFLFAKTHYSTRQLNEDYKYQQYLEKNISENVNRTNPNLDFVTFKQFNQNLIKEKNKNLFKGGFYRTMKDYPVSACPNRIQGWGNFGNNEGNIMKTNGNNSKHTLSINIGNENSKNYFTLDNSFELKFKKEKSNNKRPKSSCLARKKLSKLNTRPNSCKPGIAIDREIQENDYPSKNYCTTNIGSKITEGGKGKPLSGKSRVNGSESTNINTVTLP